MLTDDIIKQRHLERWATLVGDQPATWDQVQWCNDRLRADYVCQIADRDGISRATALLQYSLPQDVIKEILGDLPEPTRKPKRAERYQAILDWAADNIELSITTVQIADQFELSNSTASKFLQDHPDVFRPLKRGHFQIRDPKKDRAEQKANP